MRFSYTYIDWLACHVTHVKKYTIFFDKFLIKKFRNLPCVSILSMTGDNVTENKGAKDFKDLSVSTADQFIRNQDFVCSQMLMHTYMQMNWSVKNTQVSLLSKTKIKCLPCHSSKFALCDF